MTSRWRAKASSVLAGGDPRVEGDLRKLATAARPSPQFASSKPQLVLLDVQMPRMDGFEVVETVGADRMPCVIFVTAHDQYAIRAFEVSAVDYLLKPVTEERFELAFERAASVYAA